MRGPDPHVHRSGEPQVPLRRQGSAERPGDSHELPGHELPAHELPDHELPAHELPYHELPGHELPAHDPLGHELLDHGLPGHDPFEDLERLEDLELLSDHALFELVARIDRAQHRLDAALLRAVGEIDARGTTAADSGLGTASWLGAEHGLPRPVAARLVATARAARRGLDELVPAVRDGRVTSHHAAALARLTTPRVQPVIVGCLEHLVDLARGVRFEQWLREVQALIAAADPDGGHRPDGATDRARVRRGLGDTVHLDATFHGGTSQQVQAAVDEELERRYRHHRTLARGCPGHQVPSHAQLVAESIAELFRRGTAARPGARPPVTDVSLVVHAGDPLSPGGSLGPTATGTGADGVLLQDGTVRQLLCDAVIHPVVVDSLGVPLDLGRSVRAFSPQQRRAAMVRDGGCVHPGCDAPPTWTHLHHLDEVRLGGATDLRRSASLCPTHHATWHSPGWSVEVRPDGYLRITTPTGRPLVSQRHGRQPPGTDGRQPPGTDGRQPPGRHGRPPPGPAQAQ